MFKLTGLALLTATVWIVSKIKFHCKAKWDIVCTLVQLLVLVNSYLPDRPWLWSRPEHRGCQETWNSVSTSSLLQEPRPVLSLLSSTCVYLWPSNTLASPSLLSQPFKRGSFFQTGSLYCAEILSLWTFAAITMGNVFRNNLSGCPLPSGWNVCDIHVKEPKRHTAFLCFSVYNSLPVF